jgi:hypothetical protein
LASADNSVKTSISAGAEIVDKQAPHVGRGTDLAASALGGAALVAAVCRGRRRKLSPAPGVPDYARIISCERPSHT